MVVINNIMDNESLSRKISHQGSINIILGWIIFITILVVAIILDLSVFLTITQVVIGVECILTGILARRAVTSPSQYSASRYSRIQFINWIIWMVLGGLSLYLEIVITVISNPPAAVTAIVVIIAFCFYIGGCYFFYLFVQNSRMYMASFGGYQNLNVSLSGQAPQAYNPEVIYPGQAYSGNTGPGAYAGQPVYSGQPFFAGQPAFVGQNVPNQDGPQEANVVPNSQSK